MSYYETSAKTGEGIQELMSDIQNETYEYAQVMAERNLAQDSEISSRISLSNTASSVQPE